MLLSSPKELNNKCNAFYYCNKLERNMFQHGVITTAFNIRFYLSIFGSRIPKGKSIDVS